MKRIYIILLLLIAAMHLPVAAGEVSVLVKGSSWDSDSSGFANIIGLDEGAKTVKATRRGSRIALDGRPEIYAISGRGGEFELSFTTTSKTFRLIVEGDRFPRTITQPYAIPEQGGELDIGQVFSPRAEGSEHSWPLPMAATALGYGSTQEMLADDKAAIRLLTYGSGVEGAPKWAYPMKLSFPETSADLTDPEPSSTSPFLLRVPLSEYVIPFDMTTQDTYFLPLAVNYGSWIIIVSFQPGEGLDKNVTLKIEDTVTDELLDPPRPWQYSTKTILVRKGFATEAHYHSDFDQ